METTGRIFNIQKFSIHDGPGIRTTVFFQGCPLRCRWCANPESQTRNASIAEAMEDEAYRGRDYTVPEVLCEVMQDEPFYRQSGGGMTLSGGEPLMQVAFAEALADAARAKGVHVAVETTGYADPARFAEFLGHVDLLLFDFKHCDRVRHHEGTGVYNDVILENLRAAFRHNARVVIRIPVIPGFNDDLDTARAMARTLKDIGAQDVQLLPFHQLGESKYANLGIPYALAGVAQLRAESLAAYRQAYLDAGLACSFQ